MREGLFIKKNKDRWERIQNGASKDADEVAKDFTRLVDDLAYAKTFYPNGKVTPYINGLAARIYLNIYQNRKEESNRLIKFWKYDVPLTIQKHHLIILLAFVLFIIFFIVGFFSSYKDPTFVREVLSDAYVDMTERNIEEGNPFGVYMMGNSFLMWLGLMINNIVVSFMYFAKGIFFGIPTISSLIKEAMRLGAFEFMFYAKSLGTKATITILIHGILELTAIIIASSAGIVLGKSFLFPGTIKRWDSLRIGLKDGVKIVVGLMPIFIVAAFFEGFITRYYNMPLALSLLLLAASASFIIWYFIIYPVKLYRKLVNTRQNRFPKIHE
ncbi:stage II sporulation protein M [Chitinophagaceae bacterium LB-8]|uniref:Stage II sporulation protein M n=1 Tax=Paraflavisolibacter caeni TaxID=2982496 RepID=A0A9X3B789_9BACT|nr:stage II sporulation protein M [Paraflavisolibacter caeni]MCU7548945.1 stage II sporulation protein M [Paraflavisolibacter caeni]